MSRNERSISAASEQRPAQPRKYRFAIEPIAGCYASPHQSAARCIAHRYRNQSHSAFKFAAAALHPARRSTVASSATQEEQAMFARLTQLCSAFLFAGVLAASLPGPVLAGNDGIVTVKSAYPIGETVERLKKDIADKGIKLFSEIDQSKLAADAGIKLQPSVLLVFGNPPLGTQFITANANAGLDWPVRLLVFENDKGEVWTAYTDFDWIARRHGIKNRKDQFKMASAVIASITSSVTANRR
jgi:uncharacterized protein (DUF302 family)